MCLSVCLSQVTVTTERIEASIDHNNYTLCFKENSGYLCDNGTSLWKSAQSLDDRRNVLTTQFCNGERYKLTTVELS